MRTQNIKSYSPITFFLERIFYHLQYTSVANLILMTRSETHYSYKDSGDKKLKTQRRGRLVEYYILFWIVIHIICSFVVPIGSGYKYLYFLPAYRIFEIVQCTINMNIFDCLRIDQRIHEVSGITRTLILSMINFIEMLFGFGIIYSAMPETINGASSALDAYYFSFITQLTVGYGDMHPVGCAKFIAPLQGFLGFIFGLFVLSRFVSLLPKIGAVQGDSEGPTESP